ncbi:hypothetical protein DBZ36_20185 [Alginatibacterium sediminis]|uniref:Urease accessory protein UreJ n=1 Tax=Alginatibacterium sediminis TaxID=2164068 RepID=A0A420E6C0_9ALTE|nr:HupE/UreJ family protein [Alginatibacterium sediminis]RKF12789.1 hypothetical protein DBZ36_20185 [Alginatibacterium sediminis]
MNRVLLSFLAFFVAIASPFAAAHTIDTTVSNSLIHGLSGGLLHPFTGVDHLLMMFALGILMFKQVRVKTKIVAALACLALGMIAGSTLGGFVGLEGLIMASLIVAGIGLLARFRKASSGLQRFNLSLCSAALMAHGWAHGAEVSGSSSMFLLGMLSSATVIMALGLAVAKSISVMSARKQYQLEQL